MRFKGRIDYTREVIRKRGESWSSVLCVKAKDGFLDVLAVGTVGTTDHFATPAMAKDMFAPCVQRAAIVGIVGGFHPRVSEVYYDLCRFSRKTSRRSQGSPSRRYGGVRRLQRVGMVHPMPMWM